MARQHRLLQHWFAWALAAGLCSPALFARPNGFAAECGGCHYGQLEGGGRTPSPNVTAVAAANRVEPGNPVDITVTVESTWPDALVAGFLIMSNSEAGVFIPSDEGTGNVGLEEGEALEYTIGHTSARALTGSMATFHASWTAPMTTGAYEFNVFAVTSNDGDGMDDPDVEEQTNDSVGRSKLAIGVGCDLVSYYLDDDGDGYGGDELLSCDPPLGYVLQGGDCRDDNAAVNPGAVELCSFVDEDCDGDAMAPPTFYGDEDGDGYGDPSKVWVADCTQPEGYVTEAGDCAPTNPAIHPGASEVPGNAVDDNCNGMTDEVDDAPVPMGAGGTTTGGAPGSVAVPSAASSMAPMGAPVQMDTDGSGSPGCTVALPRGTDAGGTVGLMFACAGLVRRRRVPRRGKALEQVAQE